MQSSIPSRYQPKSHLYFNYHVISGVIQYFQNNQKIWFM